MIKRFAYVVGQEAELAREAARTCQHPAVNHDASADARTDYRHATHVHAAQRAGSVLAKRTAFAVVDNGHGQPQPFAQRSAKRKPVHVRQRTTAMDRPVWIDLVTEDATWGRDAHAYNLSAIRPYECRERVDQLIGRDERRRNRTTVTKLVVLIHNRPFDARSADINSKQLPHGRSPLAQCVYMLAGSSIKAMSLRLSRRPQNVQIPPARSAAATVPIPMPTAAPVRTSP